MLFLYVQYEAFFYYALKTEKEIFFLNKTNQKTYLCFIIETENIVKIINKCKDKNSKKSLTTQICKRGLVVSLPGLKLGKPGS